MIPRRRARIGLLAAALALAATSPAAAQGIEAPRVPVRTAIKEINTFRAEYADAFNRKAPAELAAMYLSDAILIRADGSTLVGRAAIGASLAERAPSWGQATISSDTMRVYGNTAWDVGTMSNKGSDGSVTLSRYLVVLRRGMQEWKISTAAVVPAPQVTATK
ncbi:MAG: YybH family protein [Gemmatimonadales bacterium]